MKRFLLMSLLGLCTLGLSAQSTYTPIKVESKYKPHNTRWSMRDTRIVDNIHGYKAIKQIKKSNQYGSDCSVRYTATGFFHTVQDGERWWLVDPEGYRHFNTAIVTFRKGNGETNKSAFSKLFHDNDELWMNKTAKMLQDLHFNGFGSWSNDEVIRAYNSANKGRRQFSYTIMLNFMSSYGRKRGGTYSLPGHTGYPNRAIFVFDKAFEEFCDNHAKRIVKYKDDANLLGYFSDNELPLDGRCLDGYLALPEGDEGRKAAEQWLTERNIAKSAITDDIRNEFAGYVAEKYYSIVSAAIRRYDPNHMYLGSRLHGRNKRVKQIIEAAGRHCDIVSINYYDHWTPSTSLMDNWGKWACKPFIITEFYTKGMDSGLPNVSGAGMIVKTQQDRAYAYQHFTLGLLESGSCVGWQWFRYLDNDPTDKSKNPAHNDSNKGLLNNEYQPYKELAKGMKQMNSNVYPLAEFFDNKRAK